MIHTCLTEVAGISRGTETEDLLAPGLAGGSTMAGVGVLTQVRGHLTQGPRPPGPAQTEEGICKVKSQGFI